MANPEEQDLTGAFADAREGARNILDSRASKEELLAIRRQTIYVLIAVVSSIMLAFGAFFWYIDKQNTERAKDMYNACVQRNELTISSSQAFQERVRIIQRRVSDPELKSALIDVLTVGGNDVALKLPNCARWLD